MYYDNEIILDIGPKTIKNIKNIIDQSIQFYGMGQLDILKMKTFMTGTMSIAKQFQKILLKIIYLILGGGDTLAAINKSKNKLFFTHLSTAGGAFLEYLEGKDLPGLSVLK